MGCQDLIAETDESILAKLFPKFSPTTAIMHTKSLLILSTIYQWVRVMAMKVL
jgi:IS30 family transposase